MALDLRSDQRLMNNSLCVGLAIHNLFLSLRVAASGRASP